jgi:hypothetical protein
VHRRKPEAFLPASRRRSDTARTRSAWSSGRRTDAGSESAGTPTSLTTHRAAAAWALSRAITICFVLGGSVQNRNWGPSYMLFASSTSNNQITGHHPWRKRRFWWPQKIGGPVLSSTLPLPQDVPALSVARYSPISTSRACTSCLCPVRRLGCSGCRCRRSSRSTSCPRLWAEQLTAPPVR